ncbi:MAG: hypothetical protein A2X49_00250 [Lentisphaerae bacterium GWF2_52_8]|nr:MAG: hypothetical protein A2X49_00250 [Lentisphaerae bacterium GWF2_52_8]
MDSFVIVDNTQYVRKEYHNRNRVRLANGDVHWLSIPVKHAGRFGQSIKDVEIDITQNWASTHKRTLFVNYKKAAFFDLYYPEFERLLSQDWKMLADFNIAFIRCCLALLEIKTPLFIGSELGISGKASELILDLCRKAGAESYLHGKHSRDYVDFELLKNAGIKNYIQDFHASGYPQCAGAFAPNLSIIDILFNCGPDTKTRLMGDTSISEYSSSSNQ